MSMSVGGATVVMVEFRRGGSEASFFKSRLELVCEVLNNGAIGGSYHGSDEHLKALDDVEAHIRMVRAFVAEERAREAAAEEADDDGDGPEWDHDPATA